MSVTLRKRKNSDGTISLLLDIYHEGKRSYEFLKSLKLRKPSNITDRQANKENLEIANKIALKRAQELATSDYHMLSDSGKKTEVVIWMQSYVDNYKKKDIRNMQGALNKFKEFLKEERETGLKFGRLNENIISDFQEYLAQHSKGEGASSYFNRFKKMVKAAVSKNLLMINPAAHVRTKQGTAKRKETLTLEEIQALAETETENKIVKHAFLFSCLTGLRWIDVSGLKWKNINLPAKQMVIEQSKTNLAVVINLNDSAVKLLGRQTDPETLVFKLPTSNGANKTLKAWVKRAGIKKAITWHNARHSFGTLLIYHGSDVTTASALLGHSSLKHTQRYVKAANDLKQRATDKLNITI